MRQIGRIEGQKLINKSLEYASAQSLRLLENFSVEGISRYTRRGPRVKMLTAKKKRKTSQLSTG